MMASTPGTIMSDNFSVWKPCKPLFTIRGEWRLNRFYQEIHKLGRMLDEAGIPYDKERYLDGWRISYPSTEACVASVDQHYASYGKEEQLLEIDGLVERHEQAQDWVLGYQKAEDVYKRIEKHWKEVWRK